MSDLLQTRLTDDHLRRIERYLPDLQDEVELRTPPLKWLLVLLGSIVFVAGGILILKRGTNPVMAWVCIGFFGLGIIIAPAVLASGRSRLRITNESFVVTMLFGSYSWRWDQVREFGVTMKRQFF